MKLTLREKYGSPLLFLIIVGLLWFGVSEAFHREEAFALLFPLHWLRFLPFDISYRFYESGGWMLWIEVIVSAIAWMTVFFMVRGMCYACTALEGPSMWIAFLLFMAVGFAFLFFILRPVLGQVGTWWQAWPGVQPWSVPGGTEGLPEVERLF